MRAGRSPAATRPAAVPNAPADELGLTPLVQKAIVGDAAREDAAYLAAVFAQTADRLLEDGRQTTPILTQRLQIETLVKRLGQTSVAGRTKGRYPELPAVIGEIFRGRFPQEAGPLQAEDRTLAIKIFSSLAAACGTIADG